MRLPPSGKRFNFPRMLTFVGCPYLVFTLLLNTSELKLVLNSLFQVDDGKLNTKFAWIDGFGGSGKGALVKGTFGSSFPRRIKS
mmetsp:Transcript_72896/g.204743  ORF Transcript_72896/g.204743 Transcript_72896/m.204743 type:complete len:84 (-) Transcript_72896:353-604(-)